MRAQRVLNKSRVPQIADYVISNPDEYILSSCVVPLMVRSLSKPQRARATTRRRDSSVYP
ncbi:DNA sulfur modification protein DndB [Rhizobium leguminosarum]|uniref:DNA sulfur modification protein DndB n=1 Tax=Rhizobium TaxID=379 RepID=UPI0021BBF819|nr:DNA sulfur modification protein DndB [Rhizobium leguminosarum]